MKYRTLVVRIVCRFSSCGLAVLCLWCAVTGVCSAQTNGVAPPLGLVAWWPGDGSADDLIDANNGVLMGGATATGSGLVGSAMSFDGTNGYVEVPDSLVFHPKRLTIEAWVCFRSLECKESGANPGHQYLVWEQNSAWHSDQEAFSLGKDRWPSVANPLGDVLYFLVAAADGSFVEVDSTTTVTTNVWYHVAGVRGSDFIQLYVNGHLEGEAPVDFPQNYGGYPLLLGKSSLGWWDGKLNGWLDEVSLYNRVLSSNEIAAIYRAGAAGKCKRPDVPPGILVEPQSVTNVAGTSASFSATAGSLLPVAYQWQFNGSNVVGAQTNTLIVPNVQLGQAGGYSLVVSNAAGTVTSAVAQLTVWVPPAISGQPQSVTNLAGTTASFSVTATGTTPFAYQWQFNGSNVEGALADTLTLTNVQPGQAGQYSVAVSNGVGVVTSAVALLSVWVPPGSSLWPPMGLVAWWPGDGSANDIIGTNNGVLMGGATATGSGLVGSAMSFDGTNGYVEVPDSPAFHPKDLTIETWVCFRSLECKQSSANPGHQYLVWEQNSAKRGELEAFSLGKDRWPSVTNQLGDVLYFVVSAADGSYVEVDSTTTVTTNVWYHVAGVRGSNFVQLYINGHLEREAPVDFPQSYGGYPLLFGKSSLGWWDGKLNGWLDEVSLYNRALSSNEIAAIYRAGAVGKCKIPPVLPAISAQPRSLTNVAGTSASFSVAAGSWLPVAYQWQFDGSNVVGAQTDTLTLTNVQPGQAGQYSVVVSNIAGVTTSLVASLTVLTRPSLQTVHFTQQGLSAFTLRGDAGRLYCIESTTNLVTWTPLLNLSNATGQVEFTAPISTNCSWRWFRARMVY